jgi:thiopurine S-methyltransferase
MERDFWIGRWQRGETGWHQTEVEPALIQFLSDGLKPTQVLVPLCGKSLDLKWLLDRGHTVIGVELSELAITEFFREHALSIDEKRAEGPLVLYRSGRLTLVQGDFFSLTPSLLRSILGGRSLGAIYDRAALIALPPEMRERYSRALVTLVEACAGSGFMQLQIVLERTPHDTKGPPFSVRESEIMKLYSKTYQVTLKSRETLPESSEGSRIDECVYTLTRS